MAPNNGTTRRTSPCKCNVTSVKRVTHPRARKIERNQGPALNKNLTSSCPAAKAAKDLSRTGGNAVQRRVPHRSAFCAEGWEAGTQNNPVIPSENRIVRIATDSEKSRDLGCPPPRPKCF